MARSLKKGPYVEEALQKKISKMNENSEKKVVILPDNIPFSKMKELIAVISWNPWDIIIEVLWNEMNVSSEWIDKINKILQW